MACPEESKSRILAEMSTQIKPTENEQTGNYIHDILGKASRVPILSSSHVPQQTSSPGSPDIHVETVQYSFSPARREVERSARKPPARKTPLKSPLRTPIKTPLKNVKGRSLRSPAKGASPMRWFPRAKKESFLERKIKLLQEKDGTIQGSLGETLLPSKLSRIEREKLASTTAAQEATDYRRVALVEAAWCRVLDLAGIPSSSAIQAAQKAEEQAAEALQKATEIGVIFRDQGPHNGDMLSAIQPGGDHLRNAIFTSVQSVRDIEREVVLAVKNALQKLANVRDEDGILDDFTDQKLLRLSLTEFPVVGKHPVEEHDSVKENDPAEFPIKTNGPGKENDPVIDTEAGGEMHSAIAEYQCVQAVNATSEEKQYGAEDGEENFERLEVLNEIAEEGEEEEFENDTKENQAKDRDTIETDGKKSHFLEELMAERVQELGPQQKAALAAIVATHSLVGNLLEELKDVRETGVRRISGGGLGDIMRKHVSRLQAEKAAASANNADVNNKNTLQDSTCEVKADQEKSKSSYEEECTGEGKGKGEGEGKGEREGKEEEGVEGGEGVGEGEGEFVEGGLGFDLQKHVSRLERDLAAAKNASASGLSEGRGPTGKRGEEKMEEGGFKNGLGDGFVKNKSRLEREIEASKAASSCSAQRGTTDIIKDGRNLNYSFDRSKRLENQESEKSLGEIVFKKQLSRLEREKLVAKQNGGDLASGSSEGRAPIEKKREEKLEEGGSRNGLGDGFVKHKSRLEKEIEARKSSRSAQSAEREATDIMKDGRNSNSSFDKTKKVENQESEPSLGEVVFKKQLSRLERDKIAAKQNEGDLAPRLAKGKKTENNGGESQGLGDILVKKEVKLQGKSNEKLQGDSSTAVGVTNKGPKLSHASTEGKFGASLIERKSRLEMEIEKAKGEASCEKAKGNSGKGCKESMSVSSSDTSVSKPGEGLGDVLVKHTSRLQREKNASLKSRGLGETKVNQNSKTAPEKKIEATQGSLSDIFPKKTLITEKAQRLEKEQVQSTTETKAKPTQTMEKAKVEGDPWGGLGLGEALKKPISRLEREKAAWKEAEARTKQ